MHTSSVRIDHWNHHRRLLNHKVYNGMTAEYRARFLARETGPQLFSNRLKKQKKNFMLSAGTAFNKIFFLFYFFKLNLPLKPLRHLEQIFLVELFLY